MERIVRGKEVEGEEGERERGQKMYGVELEPRRMEWVLILNICQHLNLLFCYQFFICH